MGGEEQLGLPADGGVDGVDRHVGMLGHVPDRGPAVAALGEELQRGLHDPSAPPAGVGQPAVPGVGAGLDLVVHAT